MVLLPCRRILVLLCASSFASPGWTLGPVLVSCMACQHAQCHLQVRTRTKYASHSTSYARSFRGIPYAPNTCMQYTTRPAYIFTWKILLGKRYMFTWSRANLRVSHSIETVFFSSSYYFFLLLFDVFHLTPAFVPLLLTSQIAMCHKDPLSSSRPLPIRYASCKSAQAGFGPLSQSSDSSCIA